MGSGDSGTAVASERADRRTRVTDSDLPLIVPSLYARLLAIPVIEKWSQLFEQHSPIYKWFPGGLGRCRLVHGSGRRLRRTTDAVGESGRTTDSFYATSWRLGNVLQ